MKLRSIDDLTADLSPAAPPTSGISPIEEIIEDARHGRMFILVGDENGKQQGNLIIPAQMASPHAINFMARHGRGIICLALTEDRASELQLRPLPRTGAIPGNTAFTVSIEARVGVTTGISVADRARTIAVAVNKGSYAEDLVSPGHVFPLVAEDRGVLARPGHTEAAVDIARLAGLDPSGVVCGIMRDDGEMAQLSDLLILARANGLKVGMIRHLVAYRCRHDPAIRRVGDIPFVSRFGEAWRVLTFRGKAGANEITVLLKGDIQADCVPAVGIHRPDQLIDLCGGERPGRPSMERLMLAVAERNTGCVVIDSGSGIDSAQILTELGVTSLELLSAPQDVNALLEESGFEILPRCGTRHRIERSA